MIVTSSHRPTQRNGRPRRTRIECVVLLSWLIFLPACPSLHQWQQDEGAGLEHIFNAPYRTVWDLVPRTFEDLGLHFVLEDKKRNYILAEGRASETSYGERVAVFVDELDRDRTRVRVISRRVWTNNLLAANWERPFLDRLGARLDALTAGSPRESQTLP